MYHIMHLKPEPFSRMKAGEKTIEYRLFDEKRKKITGEEDIIIFQNIETDEQIEAYVSEIIHAHNFSELRTKLVNKGWIEFGDFCPEKMREYYTADQIYKDGVVAIRISVIEKEPTNERDEEYKLAVKNVAFYIRTNIVNGEMERCGRLYDSNMNNIKHKLKAIFTRETLMCMSKVVDYITKKNISKEELYNNWPFYDVSADDIYKLSECTKELSYKMIGLGRRKIREYLQDDDSDD